MLDAVHDELVERLAARAAELVVGDPADAGAFTGPVIDERAVARFTRRSRRPRATARSRRAARALDLPGHFVAPTVVAGLPAGHRLTRDELFVPFVAVTRVGSFDEALAEANAIDYGLTAGVFSRDGAELDALPRRDRGRRRLRQPARGRDDRRLAGLPVVLRLEVAAARPARAGSARTTCSSSCASRAGPSCGTEVLRLRASSARRG